MCVANTTVDSSFKRIRRVDPHRKLEFEVVQQELHFEKDLLLLDGSFSIRFLRRRKVKHRADDTLRTKAGTCLAVATDRDRSRSHFAFARVARNDRLSRRLEGR